jgi:YggT family protein
VSPLLAGLQELKAILRVAFFVAAALLCVVFLLDWLVRTRRISPFNSVARFIRRTVDPMIAPVERRVVRAGGLPSQAPWWALVVTVLTGILVLVLLDQATVWVVQARTAGRFGARGVFVLLVSWTFGLLQIALLVRVVASWFRVSEYSPWIRWSVVLTEPILRPLRNVLPTVGMFDISPIVAWILLRILESVIAGSLARGLT